MPRSVFPHWILSGPLRGGRIVTSWHDYPAAILGRTEAQLLAWFEKNAGPGETWLDIGAHYGYTSIALSRLVGRTGRVFAFEPSVSTAGYLSQTRLLNRLSQLVVLPLALPQDLEMMQLPVVRGMVDSTKPTGKWMETLSVARLDWLWPRICGTRQEIHGVKIDVQGMEIDVLRGMTGLLQTLRPKLVIELHACVDRQQMLDLVHSLGYSQQGHAIEPIDGEIEPLYLDDRSYFFSP